MNEIRVRWKLKNWHKRWVQVRRDFAPASRRFEHQVCSSCGAVQPNDARVCSSCGDKLSSGVARFLKTLGLSIPTAWSVSALLGFAMLALYVRMVLANPGDGIFGWKPDVLIGYGGLWPPALKVGQWWRLATACFVHIGVMHLGFNLFALMQIGPSVEEVFGRGRMIFFFMLTGVISFAASAYFMPGTPTAGASGALMGLVGAAAGWGQRVGTSLGREVRNQMLLWGVYTMLFGVMLRANHVAHAAGFVAGGLLGLAFDPNQLEKTKRSTLTAIMGVLGGLSAAATAFLVIMPPASSRDLARQLAGRDEEEWIAEMQEYDEAVSHVRTWVNACELWAEGKQAEARAKMQELPAAPGGREDPRADLANSCIVVEGLRKQCERFETEGLAGVYGDRLPDTDEMREQMGKRWREQCALFARKSP
jgi:rhomboid protease GluP